MTDGDADLARLAEPALDLRGAEGVEVVVLRTASGLTRFAGSQVHQNVATEDVRVDVRVVAPGGRVGVVSVTTEDPAEVVRAARQALAAARLAPEDPDFPGLAPAAPVAAQEVDEATVAATPADRAEAVAAVFATVGDDLEAAGAMETGGAQLGVFTSAGQAVTARQSHAALTLVVSGPSASGFAEAGGRALRDVDAGAAGRVAAAKARAGSDPGTVAPGTWPVILEPSATGVLVQFLAYLGFGGRAWLEERAFTSGRLGERLLDPAVTIVDDGSAPGSVGWPVDVEGTPRQRVPLVERGVLAGVVHDRRTGAAAGTGSTGHALPAPNTVGPLPTTPVLAPGDAGSVADLVAGCERGLLVTRFHYTNVVQPLETVLTGMTRDGTFLVEDGQVVGGVRNLRYTASLLEAFARVDAITAETGYAAELFDGGARYPAVRLPAFTFTSATTFA